MPFIIAIDGPAASGKGTIARALASHFGFHHLDTGLLYRATGAKGGDPVAAARSLQASDLERPDLRSAEAGQAASRIAAIPEVREALVAFQHRFAAQEPGAVLDDGVEPVEQHCCPAQRDDPPGRSRARERHVPAPSDVSAARRHARGGR